MNEVYTDLEKREFIDRINDALTSVSQKLGLRNTNDNITITISCSEKEIERISKEVYEGAERMGLFHKIVKDADYSPDKVRVTQYQSPLGKLILIPNGK